MNMFCMKACQRKQTVGASGEQHPYMLNQGSYRLSSCEKRCGSFGIDFIPVCSLSSRSMFADRESTVPRVILLKPCPPNLTTDSSVSSKCVKYR